MTRSHMRRFLGCMLGLALVAAAALPPRSASALPFNDDMVDNQKRTGSVMRPKVPGTVALGASTVHLEKKEDAFNLQNPLKGDAVSAANGERLFAVNCFPCHGNIAANPHQPGPAAVASKIIPSVDLSAAAYAEKQDGYIYGTIDFGGLVMMPPLGWKLSETEHWDIINYIRKVQADKKAAGQQK